MQAGKGVGKEVRILEGIRGLRHVEASRETYRVDFFHGDGTTSKSSSGENDGVAGT